MTRVPDADAVAPEPGVFEGIVRRVDARGCEVVPLAGGEPLFCKVRGRVHRIGRDERSPLAAGDRVSVLRTPEAGIVEKVLPRRSRFRRESSAGGKPQVLAANVDLVLALLPCAEPEANPRFADRVLAAAADEGVNAVVVLSKIDLVGAAYVEDLVALYAAAGIRALPTAVPDGTGVAAVGELLRGRTSVLVGPSGAGKSTLLQAILPPELADTIRTGIVNAKTGKGRHTTTAAQLLPFPGGGWVVDTPGVRTLALRSMRPADLAMLMPDLAGCGTCRFHDCSHLVEPGCRVLEAVEAGTLDARRHSSYRAIIEQMREDAERHGG